MSNWEALYLRSAPVAFRSQKSYYLTDAFSGSLFLQPQFPFYNTYTDGDVSHPFVYEKQVSSEEGVSTHLRDHPEDKMFVKLAAMVRTHIGLRVHFVPKLRAVERFADGWVMVCMDDISCRYCRVKRKQLRKDVYQAVQDVLVLLYADEFVYGDVRKMSIMVKRDGVDSEGLGDVILIDFDWGRKRTNPSNITLNHPQLWRPKSVERGGLICSAHGDHMLGYLI